jgi:hypothetical protein
MELVVNISMEADEGFSLNNSGINPGKYIIEMTTATVSCSPFIQVQSISEVIYVQYNI